MFPLDTRTVDRLAKVVVDHGGAYERKGYELAVLFKQAGWGDPPEYDGSPRVPWFVEQLTDRQDDQAAITRLICRVCDPIEYDDGSATSEVFRTEVNAILEAEGLVVALAAGRPVLGELGKNGDQPIYSEPPDFRRRIEALIADSRTVDMLMRRLEETRICESGGAYTMAIIGIGSLVEGLLHALLTERDTDLRTNGFPDLTQRSGVQQRGRMKADRVSLQLLIETAHAKDWIQLDAKKFTDTVRDFRNFVHPRKELSERPRFDQDSVMLCWAPVHALLNDLEENVPPVKA
ncbi:hypothetical protein [Amycolatopsis sp. lyj-108]|uniref:hypothetical protein n=1 Tax=Amycolatopsis sp. lyj-108 TaxID=2789286 RepID=UPI00397CF07B